MVRFGPGLCVPLQTGLKNNRDRVSRSEPVVPHHRAIELGLSGVGPRDQSRTEMRNGPPSAVDNFELDPRSRLAPGLLARESSVVSTEGRWLDEVSEVDGFGAHKRPEICQRLSQHHAVLQHLLRNQGT